MIALQTTWTYQDSALTDYSQQFYQFRPAFFSRFTQLPSGKHYVGLGTGTGKDFNQLARLCPDYQFTGVEFNADYVAIAKQDAPTNVEYVCCDFKDYQPNKFIDYVVTTGIYSWVYPEDRQSMHKIYKDYVSDNGIIAFGYNNALFWQSMRVIRELAIILAQQCDGDWQTIRTQLLALNKLNYFDKNESIKHFLIDVINQAETRAHWIFQPSWECFYSADVRAKMIQDNYKFIVSNDLPTTPSYAENIALEIKHHASYIFDIFQKTL
ncbi:class I SAM-dependent methyltransferase [Zooshikella marina]|uniref:class I SAM-dependent methyltransferase n=1 Tax=Zooshikella ganghwensis TaxID=202772 RepID=UPI001BAF0A1C|nr:class I SAM-dependent methyltransferase [Zooshikella ganghwensis]MBU2708873.1 class I SAM-dependent methyltransferase [Zooshikella ganghwensis]